MITVTVEFHRVMATSVAQTVPGRMQASTELVESRALQLPAVPVVTNGIELEREEHGGMYTVHEVAYLADGTVRVRAVAGVDQALRGAQHAGRL